MATYQHGYDRRTAFQLLKQGGPFWWKFSHWARPFDDQKIRAMLAALSKEVQKRSTGSFSAAALFMISMMADVPSAQLQSTWRDTMAALDGLNAYEFGARKKKHDRKTGSNSRRGRPRLLGASGFRRTCSRCCCVTAPKNRSTR